MSAEILDVNREVSLQLLKSVRAFAVRTPKGQKDPGHFKWDPRANNKELSDQTIFNLERSDDNLGVHLFGPVVDVDIDSDNPHLIAALDYFLPPTAHVWGRPSRPRTHRLYELSGAKAEYDSSMFPFLAKLQAYSGVEVEVRGGQMKNGEYSLLPGSLHPSGEAYEWSDLRAARSTPVTADIHRIVNAVRYSCAVAAIAPYWTEGVRNNMCMALSGFFHRASTHIAEMGSASAFEFSREDAKNLLEALLVICDDDPSDKIMRMKTFDMTWDKAETGTPVSGATTIAKLTGNDELVTLLYMLLADSPDMVELDEFMQRYAVRNSSSTIIDIERAGSKLSKYVMSKADLENSTMHKTIQNSAGGRVPMAAILLRSARAIRVEGLAFDPEGEKIIERQEGKFINQWRGWGIPMHEEPVKDQEILPFLRHIEEVVADNDPLLAEWILNWMADIFKYPASKAGTALVLVGLPGAGKSMIGEKILQPIIGDTHSAQTNSIESVVGNFNADSANLLFMQCDEAMNSRRRQDANKLKSLITDHKRRVEFKGVDAMMMDDCCCYLITSNDEEDAVAIVDGENDRRYTVGKISNVYAAGFRDTDPAKKHAYWKTLYEFLEYSERKPHVENLAKIHRWLYDRIYDRASIRVPYVTNAKQLMAQHSQRGLDDWLMEIVGMPHPFQNLRDSDQRMDDCYVKAKGGNFEKNLEEWPDMVNYQRVQDSYDFYRKRKGMSATTPTYNITQLKASFVTRGLMPEDHVSARVRTAKDEWANGVLISKKQQIYVYQFPSREGIQEFLFKKYGFRALRHNDVSQLIGSALVEPKHEGPEF